MKSSPQKLLWNDDRGQVALEYLLLLTIVGLGLVIGFTAVEKALDAELVELANAIMALSQGYQISSQTLTGCSGNIIASKQGTVVTDTPGRFTFTAAPVLAPAPTAVTLVVCP